MVSIFGEDCMMKGEKGRPEPHHQEASSAQSKEKEITAGTTASTAVKVNVEKELRQK